MEDGAYKATEIGSPQGGLCEAAWVKALKIVLNY